MMITRMLTMRTVIPFMRNAESVSCSVIKG